MYSPDETKTESISGVLRKPIGPDLGPEFEVWGGGINSLDNLLKIREINRSIHDLKNRTRNIGNRGNSWSSTSYNFSLFNEKY